jgi:UDP-N-acetylglucosamine--N-acetylmuramyl-(pentapeptide) pyrophosphoryl-undecaprenol N-acetylglucosamine transferase
VSQNSDAPLIVFAGGGTGGHLYPALAIADAIQGRLPRARFRFFGTQRPIDKRILGAADCDLVQQTLPPLRRAPWRWPKVYLGFRRSSLLCRSHFERDPPAVVIGTGGLGSVPAVREAIRAGIPTGLLNPDAIPGRANRYLAGSADVVFAQWEETRSHLSSECRVVVGGCPVRSAFNRAVRAQGVERFGLNPRCNTLLVTGASQGARTINEAVVASLDRLASYDDWQVLHLTGDRDYDMVREAYGGWPVQASVLRFTEHMAEALAAADLVIARAGASSLAEVTAVGRASILMPYPFHRDQHQLANARCLVRASAARIVHDRVDPTINGPALWQVLDELMSNDDVRKAMAESARKMGRGHAASEVAGHILDLAAANGTLGACESLEALC